MPTQRALTRTAKALAMLQGEQVTGPYQGYFLCWLLKHHPNPKGRTIMDYRQAEGLVCEDLKRRAWQVLATNLRGSGFELDIVARQHDTLAVIEVKARAGGTLESPDLAGLLPWRKQQALWRGARYYISHYQPSFATLRFDLAVVLSGKVADRGSASLPIRYFINVMPDEQRLRRG